MSFPQKLKTDNTAYLKIQQTNLEQKLDQLYSKKKVNNQQIEETEYLLGRVKKELAERQKTPELSISEHAVMRYLERVTGIDMQVIRDAIVPPKEREAILKLGDGEYQMGTHTAVIKDQTVVTIIV